MAKYTVRVVRHRHANGPGALVEVVAPTGGVVDTVYGKGAGEALARHLNRCTETIRCRQCPPAVLALRRQSQGA